MEFFGHVAVIRAFSAGDAKRRLVHTAPEPVPKVPKCDDSVTGRRRYCAGNAGIATEGTDRPRDRTATGSNECLAYCRLGCIVMSV